MDIIDIAGRTHVFRAPKDWNEERDGFCGALLVRAEPYAHGLYKMISEWKPNEIELEHLKLGAPLQLGVIGSVHPVVSLGVGAVPAPDAEDPNVKMTKIQRLMNVLERGPDMLTLDEEQAAFAGARQLILALLGISAKPKGEQIAVALGARARELAGDEDGDLDTMVKFARRWLPECFPATEAGQVPFARAVVESVLDAAEHHLKRYASAPPAPTPEAGSDLAGLSERARNIANRCYQRADMDEEISKDTLTEAATVLEKMAAHFSSPSPLPGEGLAGQGERDLVPELQAVMGTLDDLDLLHSSEIVRAARDKIAALTPAAPRPADCGVIAEVERLLTNMQPHIPQSCLPGHEKFIDNYVNPALELLRGALQKAADHA